MDERSLGAYTMVRLVGEMVRALVDDPHKVRVDGRDGDGFIVVNVRVAPGDVGKVIGIKGRNARCLRTITSAAAAKSKLRCELNIVGFTPKAGEV